MGLGGFIITWLALSAVVTLVIAQGCRNGLVNMSRAAKPDLRKHARYHRADLHDTGNSGCAYGRPSGEGAANKLHHLAVQQLSHGDGAYRP